MYFRSNVLKVLLLTVFLSSAIVLGDTTGEKKLNLRIGFDLTQGSNGAPSLRIRDFEGKSTTAAVKPVGRIITKKCITDNDSSELVSKTVGDELGEYPTSPVIRADSFSDSDETPREDDTSIQVENGNKKSDNDEEYDNSGDGNRIRSTKGLNPAEYEPEGDNPSLHAKYKDLESSESDDNRRRPKREAGFYDILKRKSKKIAKHYTKKINKLKQFLS